MGCVYTVCVSVCGVSVWSECVSVYSVCECVCGVCVWCECVGVYSVCECVWMVCASLLPCFLVLLTPGSWCVISDPSLEAEVSLGNFVFSYWSVTRIQR